MVQDHFWKSAFLTLFYPFLAKKQTLFKAFLDFVCAKTCQHGLKQDRNNCLNIPNGPKTLLEKDIFDPFLTHFWSQDGPFSRHCGSFHELLVKMNKTHLFEHPQGSRMTFGKILFLIHFGPFFGPKMAHYQSILG